MNKKIFLILFIFGFYTQSSFAIFPKFRKLKDSFNKPEITKEEASKKLLLLDFRNHKEAGSHFLELISSDSIDEKIKTLAPHKTSFWREVIDNLQNTVALDLSKTKLQHVSICNLCNLDKINKLAYLDLSGNPEIKNHLSFGTFSEQTCEKLEFLDLSFISLQLKDLEGLSELKTLTHLILINCELKNDFLEELSQCENIVKTLQKLNLSNNREIQFNQDLALTFLKFEKIQELILIGNSIKKSNQDHASFLKELKEKMQIVLSRQKKIPYLEKIDEYGLLLSFIPSMISFYSHSGSQDLLENYLSLFHAKVVSNLLKSFYVLSFYYLLLNDGSPRSLPIQKSLLLCTVNFFVLLLESKWFQT